MQTGWFVLIGGLCLTLLGMLSPAGQTAVNTLTIPALNWTEHSDWVNVKTDVTPAAVGDGVADDTVAIQKAFAGVTSGSVIYLPAGTYRITDTLRLRPAKREDGVLLVGHGRDTQLVWDGPAGKPMIFDSAVSHSRYEGLLFDGRGKAIVGLYHSGDGPSTFETEVGHRHLAFLNFTDAGILADVQPATAEVMIENCLFENCKRGIAFLVHNMYDYSIDGCEFRRCETGIQCRFGNTYIRNCHFEGSGNADIMLHPEHGSSVRRCTSVGSNMFVQYTSPVSPVTIQDCRVAKWTNRDGAIQIGGAPVTIFDCVFTNPPGKMPPVQIRSHDQRLFLSQNISKATDGICTSKIGTVYTIPAGKRRGSLTSAHQRFLRDTATVPTVIFDARRDFGAKGNRSVDDTDAIQRTINAARAHGNGAIAYLPSGDYTITQPLRVTGADYIFGGSGNRSGLWWKGAAGGNIIEVTDPQHVTVENLGVGIFGSPADMTNGCDILQTGAGKSFVTYDNVSVFGTYQKQPFRKGLVLRNLGKGAVVRVGHVQGNIRLENAARATILLANSIDGSVVVEGKAKERDGFFGIMTHLSTITTYALYVKDNQSLVASDFYIEQADNGYSFAGSPDDPPGRITIQSPKLHLTPRANQPGIGFDIHGYHGQITIGPLQHYLEPIPMPLMHTGDSPVNIILWGHSFYNTKLSVQKQDTARVSIIGNYATDGKAEVVPVDESYAPDTLAKLAVALDDLRLLGEIDLRLNHRP